MAWIKHAFFDVTIAGAQWPKGKGFTIYEFFSHQPGKGNAAKALKELNVIYGRLSVTDIGYPGDNSYRFWRHMLAKKLVEEVHDDRGRQHRKASTMVATKLRS
jgi:hypothetical protein